MIVIQRSCGLWLRCWRTICRVLSQSSAAPTWTGRTPSAFVPSRRALRRNLLAFQSITNSRFDDARETLAIARPLSARVSALFSWGYAVGLGGMNLLAQGRLSQALEHLGAGMNTPGIADRGSFAAAAIASVHCLALYESGALDEAERQFYAFRNVAASASLVDFLRGGLCRDGSYSRRAQSTGPSGRSA